MKRSLSNKLTIGFADDDIVFRNLIISDVCKNMQRESVFCANDGKELIAQATIYKPKMIILDLYMPVMSGIEAIVVLKSEQSNLDIIAYSHVFQQDIFRNLKQLGVSGYCKNDKESISAVVENIEHGNRLWNDDYYTKWAMEGAEYKNSLSQLVDDKTLSSTELNIILLSCEGKGNKEIALQMSLSKRTIDTYVGQLLEKLELRHKSDLISFAYRNGICTLTCSSYGSKNCNRPSLFQRNDIE